MKYRMIVSDVDGTLLDDAHRMPEENRKAIEEFRNEGGLFSLATGRIEKSAVSIQRELGIDLPLILYNGAKIIDLSRNTVVSEKFLLREQAEAAVEALKAFPVPVIVYSGGEGYTTEYCESIKKHAEMEGITPLLAGGQANLDFSRVNKILLAGNNDDGDDSLFAGFLAEYEKRCARMPFIVRSNKKYLELLPEGVNKGTALEILAEYLGLKTSEIMCFGDNLNDYEMIEKAGFGVAMGNGHEDLKKIASLVAPPNSEAGVASVIREYIECSRGKAKKPCPY